MHIELRKIGGRLEAFFCRDGGGSYGAGATAGAVQRFLTSTLMLAVLVIAFLVAWTIAHPVTLMAQGHALHPMTIGFAGMAANVRELRAKRANVVTELRAITDKAETEKRALNADEETRYTKLFGDVEELRKQIDREEQLAEAERSVAEQRSRDEQREDRAGEKKSENRKAGPRGTEEYRSAFSRFIDVGERGLKPEEARALSVGSDTGGGFTQASEQFVTELIKNVDNIVIMRQLATKRPVATAASLGVASLDTDPDDADWTSELAVGNEDSSMAFGKRKLYPHPLAKLIKVSKDFLRVSTSGGESLVRERLAYKNGVAQEKGFMTGTGQQQALGIFTASADGIPTTRDVSTGNTTTAPTFDGLLGAKYALKAQYRNDPTVRWILHPDVLLAIAKLKNGDGDYIWKESVREGEPDKILGIPLLESQYAPNTMTTGQYVAALGAWSNYWIADALDFAVQRLDELYAATNQVGFICRSACDGQFTLAEAAVRVKLA